jgi:hypothetical protein
MDALQLAAHELGARPAKVTPPGLYVVTAAGRAYLKMLKPFQKSPLAEGGGAGTDITRQIQALGDVIYEQLLRWPRVPFGVQQ